MSRIHTAHKFRHYRPDEAGRSSLIWAPGYGEIPVGEILEGSPADLDVRRSQLWTPNTLADEGENDILDVYFNDQAVRASLFLRLYNDTPIETDTLATLVSETSGSGYGPITVTRDTDWTEPALDGGDGQTTMTQKTFTATGAWTDATYMILATVGTGTAGLHIAFVALSATRTLQNGDTLNVDLDVKLA